MTVVGVYRSEAAWRRRFWWRVRLALPIVAAAAIAGSIAAATWALKGVLP